MLGMANHPAPPLAVSESEAEALRAMARAGTTEQRTALRAKIILRAAEGVANVAIATELGVSVPTVGLWRTRFKERGLAGLADGTPDRPAGDLGPGDPGAGPRHDPDPTGGSDPLEHPPPGQGGRGQPEHDPADLARGPTQAAPDRDVQVQP